MTDPQASALIDRLERAARWWKRLALGALATLLLVVLVGAVVAIVRARQVEAERGRAEEALRELEAQRDAERAQAEQARREAEAQREQTQRILYVHELSLAHREWAAEHDRQGQKKNP
jgi:hypothetical protein